MTQSNIFVCNEAMLLSGIFLRPNFLVINFQKERPIKNKEKNAILMKIRWLLFYSSQIKNILQSWYNLQNISESIPFMSIVMDGFYPTFLFFKFLKNGCKYQIQIWLACKTNKMPIAQH